MSTQSEIVKALVDGFEETIVDNDGEDMLVYVDDRVEPIRVTPNDIILPDWAKPLASSIRLDVATVLAEFDSEDESQ